MDQLQSVSIQYIILSHDLNKLHLMVVLVLLYLMVVLVLLYLMWALLVEVVLWWVAQLQKDIQ